MNNDLALQQFYTAVYRTNKGNVDGIKLGLSLLETGDFQQRWEVAKLFPKLGKDIIDPLLTVLEDETIEVEYRWFVARILGQFHDEKVIISLVKLLETTEEEELLTIIAEALGNMGISAINSLEKLLIDDSSKLLVVKALAQIRHSETILPLLKVVDDPNSNIRAIAIESLGSFHQKQLIPIFSKALNDPASVVRKEAIIALAMQPEFTAEFEIIKQLKPLLYDIDLEVSKQAASALGRIKASEAIELLSLVLNKETTPLELKKEVIKALNWTETAQALDYLKQALWKEELELSKMIINLLGTQTNEILKIKASQILIDFLSSEKAIIQEQEIKQAIAISVGELGNKMAINVLNKLEQDSNKAVQLHAIAALKKFD
ncbi:MAG: HEAT repeat domain-containing protein [Crocosphaera sp.]|jgi:HEAT repeat protein